LLFLSLIFLVTLHLHDTHHLSSAADRLRVEAQHRFFMVSFFFPTTISCSWVLQEEATISSSPSLATGCALPVQLGVGSGCLRQLLDREEVFFLQPRPFVPPPDNWIRSLPHVGPWIWWRQPAPTASSINVDWIKSHRRHCHRLDRFLLCDPVLFG
jgi:hypothetical protein